MGTLLFILLGLMPSTQNNATFQDISVNAFFLASSNTLLLVKGAQTDAYFSIISRDGKLIQSGNLQGKYIDVALLHKGVYYVKTLSDLNQPFTFSFAL